MSWTPETEYLNCTTIGEVLDCTVEALQRLRQEGFSIHHVAGAISADGDEHIARNLAELLQWRTVVAQGLGSRAIVLTSPLVFTTDIYTRLRIFDMPREARENALQEFWDGVLESGLFDSVYFTPGYERSPGARREHETALRYGVTIKYLQQE